MTEDDSPRPVEDAAAERPNGFDSETPAAKPRRSIGIAHYYRGHLFREVGQYDYEVRRGRTLRFLEIQTCCAACGAGFEFDATLRALRMGWVPTECHQCGWQYSYAAGQWVRGHQLAAIEAAFA